MTDIQCELLERLIPIEMQTIHSFDDVEEEVIFNCSGLGSKKLNQDANMIPVRGHLILLNEEAGTEHMDYIIYTNVDQLTPEKLDQLDAKEFQKLLDRNSLFFHGAMFPN